MRRIFFCCLLAAPTALHADVIVLDNGDRLSGRVQSMEDGRLVFDTDLAQELELPWERVRELSTDEPVRVMLVDQTWLHGRLSNAGPDRVELYDADAHADVGFELGAVAALNPSDGPDQPPVTTQGRIDVGANVTRGNTRTDSARADAEFIARSSRNRYTLGGEANYGKDDGERNQNDARGYARYDHFLNERLYLNSNVSLARDEFRDLTLRSTFGIGLGYQFRDTERQRISLEGGISYVHENFDEAPDESRPAARLAMDYEQKLGGGGHSLFHRNESLLGLDDTDEFLFRSRTGLRFPLGNGLSGTVQVNYDYDNVPPPDNQRSDVAYQVTLGYAW